MYRYHAHATPLKYFNTIRALKWFDTKSESTEKVTPDLTLVVIDCKVLEALYSNMPVQRTPTITTCGGILNSRWPCNQILMTGRTYLVLWFAGRTCDKNHTLNCVEEDRVSVSPGLTWKGCHVRRWPPQQWQDWQSSGEGWRWVSVVFGNLNPLTKTFLLVLLRTRDIPLIEESEEIIEALISP